MVLLAPHPNQWIQHDPAPSTMKSWAKVPITQRKMDVFPFFSLIILLVGGIPTHLKNMKVSWDYYSQHMEK